METGGKLSRGVAVFLGTGAYTGYAPFAPGTFGTLPALLIAGPLALLADRNRGAYAVALLLILAVAVWAAGRCSRIFCDDDPSKVVIDEVAGYLIAVALLPATATTLIAGFVLFRVFDIFKPPPARWAEGLHGGYGIVADDLVAGFYANVLLRAAHVVSVISLG
ncbi:MAG: phosphatidylglycerophosphatase A [Candidatus Binatia bacterium]